MTGSIVITIESDHPIYRAFSKCLDESTRLRSGFVMIAQSADGTWSASFAHVSPRGPSSRLNAYLVQIHTVKPAITDESHTETL